MILSRGRDPRLVTVRRGGTLTDDDHRLLAAWAAFCAERVLPHFESMRPGDDRPHRGPTSRFALASTLGTAEQAAGCSRVRTLLGRRRGPHPADMT